MGCASPDRRAVFVLGSHRAGTSVLARALIASGVYFGENLYGPRIDNPKGFFEDKIANQLDENFLASIQCRWNSLCLPPDISKSAITTYQSRLREDVLDRFATKRLWGLKDPRISRLWKHWLPVLADADVEPILVMASRHPFSVASSLAKRDQLPQAHALALWAFHQLDALESLLQHQAIVVDYDMMMDEPRHQLLRIANFLGEGNRLDQEEVQKFESEFLSKDLRHTRYQHESAAGDLQMLCLELHAEIVKLALLPSGLEASHRNGLNDLLSMYRTELKKSFEWMLAIDELQSNRAATLDSATAPVIFETKMFWKSEWTDKHDGYSEERATSIHYSVDGKRRTIALSFSQDPGRVNRIRLDIINAPGILDLSGLRFLDASGELLWLWPGDLSVFQHQIQLIIFPGLSPEFYCTVISLGNDPRFELELPPEIYQQLSKGCVLEIELTPYSLLDRLPIIVCGLVQKALLSVGNYGDAKGCFRRRVRTDFTLAKDLETVKNLLRDALTKRNQTIMQQSSKMHKLQEEVIRAEAQVDLLRDVLKDGSQKDRIQLFSSP